MKIKGRRLPGTRCPQCGRPLRTHHRLHREIWVDDGYSCDRPPDGCGALWTADQLRSLARSQSIDMQATRYVEAHVKRQKKLERLAKQLPVVETQEDGPMPGGPY